MSVSAGYQEGAPGWFRRIDGRLNAFVEIGEESTVAIRPAQPRAVLTAGMAIGVKDVIDVEGFRTRCGSDSLSEVAPADRDAVVVGDLRKAGVVPVGKTATTEFAFIDPCATRNPYQLSHSPGGSSSGSAAAVAAGLVPLALGTQTAGSLCRPAAYCGIAAIKPSFGLLPTTGLTGLAPTFDTIGVMARTVVLAAAALDAMTRLVGDMPDVAETRIAVMPASRHHNSAPEVARFHATAIDSIRRIGGDVVEIEPPVAAAELIALHRTVMLHEAHALHGALLARSERLRPKFREALVEGARIDAADAARARAALADAAARSWDRFATVDALLLQPVPAPAPAGLGSTGDQSYQTPWTVLGGPLVVVPGELSPEGLPLAAMIAAAPGRDRIAIAIAAALQPLIDRLPPYAVVA